MAFTQTGLERTFNHKRGGFDTFVYRTADTISTVSANGYFNSKEFGYVSLSQTPHFVNVHASDGYFTVEYDFENEVSLIVNDYADLLQTVSELSAAMVTLKTGSADYPALSTQIIYGVAVDTPTVSYNATSQLTGTEYASNDQAAFKYMGGSIIEDVGTGGNTNILTTKNAILAGATVDDRVAVISAGEFITESSLVEVRVGSSNANGIFRLIVDGQVAAEVTPSENYILIDYSAFPAKSRKCRLEFRNFAYIRSLKVENTESVTATTTAGLKITYLGDSFTTGTGVADARKHDAYSAYSARLLGAYDYRSSGLGGTGYLKVLGTDPSLATRMAADAVSSDVYVIAMGINDTDADIASDINTMFDTLRSNNPTQPVFVLSAWGDGVGGENNPLINASIQAAAAGRVGFYYVPVWEVAFTKSDGTHPDEAGHKTLGNYIAQQIRLAY